MAFYSGAIDSNMCRERVNINRNALFLNDEFSGVLYCRMFFYNSEGLADGRHDRSDENS
jgi:hypothetical protein